MVKKRYEEYSKIDIVYCYDFEKKGDDGNDL